MKISPDRRAWRSLSLDEALSSLEDGLLPHPSSEDLVYFLLKCKKERDSDHALRLHAYMRASGFEGDRLLGNYLVPLLVDVGSMQTAQRVFDKLAHPNEWSWESLITGYIKYGNPLHALLLYQRIEKAETVCLSNRILIALLKACIGMKDLKRGLKIHAELSRVSLLEKDISVGSMVIDMYAKCGLLAKAQQVFSELSSQDVVSWTTLLAAYGEHGYGEHAIKCFDQMKLKGVSPNSVTFVCILKACGSIGAIDKIREIHLEIENQGLLDRELVGNTLIDMYARCGSLDAARQIFNKLPSRDVVSWNTLIAGYTEQQLGEEALKCFDGMQLEGISPNAITFVCSLRACGIVGATYKGEEIYNEIERQGLLEQNHFVGCALIDMYSKHGLLAKARKVFDKLRVKDVVSWTALIAGYVEYEHDEEALECLEQMVSEGISPNAVTFVSSLKACGSVGMVDRGQNMHAEIERQGLVQGGNFVGNSLVDMYVKCGSFVLAEEVFNKLPVRDIVSWNALIGGYTEHGLSKEALMHFEQMQVEGVVPDALTYVCCLKACGSIRSANKGSKIHLELKKQGLLETDIIGNALVDMYAKCGLLLKAQQVFDKFLDRDVVAWTALIAGYTEIGDGEKALECFDKMQQEGVPPNAVTLVCSLKACGTIAAIDKGSDLHADVERQELLETDLAIGNTLVDMYGKCGWFALSQQVFDKLPNRDIVSWNALIAAYADCGHVEDALLCFEQMQLQGFFPNLVTYVSILKSCGNIGATEIGGRLHSEIERRGLLEGGLIGNTLLNMYAKCGSLAKASQVFDNLPVRDVVSWTALMAGYAEVGESDGVFYIFDRMQGEGVKPNPVTFVVVLSVCTRMGLLKKCQTYFEAMSKDYGVFPNLEHHSCMVDILGRTGQPDMAVAMIKKMPFHPSPVMWHAVLDSCRKWGSLQDGKHAFEHAMHIDDSDCVPYVHMSQIYADTEMQEQSNICNA